MFLNCPEQELLLEFVTIPQEVSIKNRLLLSLHMKTCERCQEQSKAVQKKWNAYFKPEPEITSSLIKVYSKLKQDETLILKGWKLGETESRSRNTQVTSNWLFRGAISVGLLLMVFFVALSQSKNTNSDLASSSNNHVPYAQIRLEEKNRVKVQYMKPELLQTVEFETSGTGR